jgi:phosphoglycerate dehydrogenase-like enzyme
MSERVGIFCDTEFPREAAAELAAGLRAHRVLRPAVALRGNLAASQSDPAILEAEIAFGQPDPASLLAAPRLRFAQLTSAGYTRYDEPRFRGAARSKGLALCSSSTVYAEPCAEHLLALILATARRLPDCCEDQHQRGWHAAERRRQAFLLRGQTVVLLGYGAIARRLTELLAPFEVQILALDRAPRGDETVTMLSEEELDAALARADHLVDVLPENATTAGFLDARRLAKLQPSATVYNIGRGTTLDHPALCAALRSGAIAGAYLDVTDPEPLPPGHPLWDAPGCHITPHMAGGRNTEHVALVRHFLANLARYERGEPLRDRVV